MGSGEIVPTNLSDFLRAIPYEIKGQWFFQKTVYLDGYSFSNCRFDNCTIFISRGIFRLINCYALNCMFFYTDEARNVARLFAGMHVPVGSVPLNPSLRPINNADGTFTIDNLDA